MPIDTRYAEPIHEVNDRLKSRSRQLAALQEKYNRVCAWVRSKGRDPVAIANGKVEIGERVEVEG